MQNRGMKKWRPFATMPEQYRGLQEIIKKAIRDTSTFFNRRSNGTD
ncbi:hypothetical protein ACLHDF_29335 [Priestia aryabhattai]